MSMSATTRGSVRLEAAAILDVLPNTSKQQHVFSCFCRATHDGNHAAVAAWSRLETSTVYAGRRLELFLCGYSAA